MAFSSHHYRTLTIFPLSWVRPKFVGSPPNPLTGEPSRGSPHPPSADEPPRSSGGLPTNFGRTPSVQWVIQHFRISPSKAETRTMTGSETFFDFQRTPAEAIAN